MNLLGAAMHIASDNQPRAYSLFIHPDSVVDTFCVTLCESLRQPIDQEPLDRCGLDIEWCNRLDRPLDALNHIHSTKTISELGTCAEFGCHVQNPGDKDVRLDPILVQSEHFAADFRVGMQLLIDSRRRALTRSASLSSTPPPGVTQ